MPAPRCSFSPRAGDLAARTARELASARALSGLTQRAVARRAHVSQSFVGQVERGHKVPSLRVMQRLASATGHDLSIRLFPGAGVRLRDSGQLQIAELLRRTAHPSWHVQLEVPVGAPPDRRAADLVLDTAAEIVQVEIERALLDVQAQLRAAQLKRATMAERLGRAIRLVIAIPDTRRNRAVVKEHAVIGTAFPTPSKRVLACLRSGTPLGGDGLLWVRVSSPLPADDRGFSSRTDGATSGRLQNQRYATGAKKG